MAAGESEMKVRILTIIFFTLLLSSSLVYAPKCGSCSDECPADDNEYWCVANNCDVYECIDYTWTPKGYKDPEGTCGCSYSGSSANDWADCAQSQPCCCSDWTACPNSKCSYTSTDRCGVGDMSVCRITTGTPSNYQTTIRCKSTNLDSCGCSCENNVPACPDNAPEHVWHGTDPNADGRYYTYRQEYNAGCTLCTNPFNCYLFCKSRIPTKSCDQVKICLDQTFDYNQCNNKLTDGKHFTWLQAQQIQSAYLNLNLDNLDDKAEYGCWIAKGQDNLYSSFRASGDPNPANKIILDFPKEPSTYTIGWNWCDASQKAKSGTYPCVNQKCVPGALNPTDEGWCKVTFTVHEAPGEIDCVKATLLQLNGQPFERDQSGYAVFPHSTDDNWRYGLVKLDFTNKGIGPWSRDPYGALNYNANFYGYAEGSAPSINLLQNPGFETDTAWARAPTHTVSNSKAHTGSYSLKSTHVKSAGSGVATTQTVAVKSQTQYELSGWIFRSNGAGAAYLDLSDVEEDKQFCGDGGVSASKKVDNWERVSCTFTTAADRESLTVRLVTDGPHDTQKPVWFDDISLIEIKASPQMPLEIYPPNSILWLNEQQGGIIDSVNPAAFIAYIGEGTVIKSRQTQSGQFKVALPPTAQPGQTFIFSGKLATPEGYFGTLCKDLAIVQNYCGDGIIQRPNMQGEYEMCDAQYDGNGNKIRGDDRLCPGECNKGTQNGLPVNALCQCPLEVCDRRDNDGDNQVDEGFRWIDGMMKPKPVDVKYDSRPGNFADQFQDCSTFVNIGNVREIEFTWREIAPNMQSNPETPLSVKGATFVLRHAELGKSFAVKVQAGNSWYNVACNPETKPTYTELRCSLDNLSDEIKNYLYTLMTNNEEVKFKLTIT
ncbi:MAG: carbohydrate binding domain-containing protein [Candidatus Woesearchaeota archaeon]